MEQTSTSATEDLPLEAQISSLLFVSPRPVTAEALASVLDVEIAEVESALAAIRTNITDGVFGFTLEEIAGGFQFRSSPKCSEIIAKFLAPKGKRLSKAAAETLAVIAYKQPVQRAEIEAIRGVDVLPTLKTLLDNKLVRVIGHDVGPGQPALYGTTDVFLEKFGLRDLADLPSLRDMNRLLEEPGEADVVARAERDRKKTATVKGALSFSDTPEAALS